MSEYRPPFLDKVDQWNKFNRNSGGTLVEKCCHYFDLINVVAQSRPRRVYASGGRAVNFLDFEWQGEMSDIDDHAMVIIDYDNDVRASFTLNMFCQELYEELVVVGERGRLVASEQASFQPDTPSKAELTGGGARASRLPGCSGWLSGLDRSQRPLWRDIFRAYRL